MRYSNVKIGSQYPREFNTIIEISMNSGPVKYEFDKDMNALVVDRFIQPSMQYPCNYGFIPHTLSGDNDPVDVLVYTTYPIAINSVISVRAVGVLLSVDEKGADEKILAIPTNKVDPYFNKIVNYTDLPKILIQKIEHFFLRYKDLENGKWIKICGWKDYIHAQTVVQESISRYNRQFS